ncbi:helix-turn-helix domain-containing protein [Deinococcus hopiensis]|uniref:helix-turn-helix domain-containing protein n=1 Tax=Deinococcus hopiensis TaxID=309885 RepID=UPI001FE30C63|nr:helix-turn-helix domain-containing protein [Deinococcus hopiensis]
MRRIIELKAAGQTVSGIARQLDLSRNTVKKYLRDPGLPQPKSRRKKGSKLDSHIPYLTGRIEQGVLSAVVLFNRRMASRIASSLSWHCCFLDATMFAVERLYSSWS